LSPCNTRKTIILTDTIKREKVYEAMRQMGIGEKLIRLVRMTLKETEYKVLANGQLSGKFKVKRGLRQWDPLSRVLFNVTLDSAVKASEIRGNGLIYRDIFLTLNIVHTYSLCSILKNTYQCIVSCYATNYTEHLRF
jgi:hypothetical protein